jgi:hypothetical protein
MSNLEVFNQTPNIPCIGELTSVVAVDIGEFAKYAGVLGIGPTHPPCAPGTIVDDPHEWFDGGAVEWWDPKERFVVIVPNEALE